MSVLGRLIIGSQQRIDLPDFLAIDSYTSADFRAIIKTMVGDNPFILKGFEVENAPNSIGSTGISINIVDAVLYNPESAAGSFYYGLPEGDPLSQPLVPEIKLSSGALTTTNYIYITLTTTNGAPDNRAFWDVDLNGGEGGEFNQEINTESILTVQVGSSVSSFPEGTIPVAKVETNISAIISITDCRNLMFRLGSGGLNPDPSNKFPFRDLPNSSFNRDEPLPAITSTSAPSPFFGGDKNIRTLKEWMDAVMTVLSEVSGSSYWYKKSTSSISNTFGDALCSSIQSKGQWQINSSSGAITWTEDIIHKKVNDPREFIIRQGSVSLFDDQVLYLQLSRGSNINTTNTYVEFYNASSYVYSIGVLTGSSPFGDFENLKKGDWIKPFDDPDTNYRRIEEFYVDSIDPSTITTPALANIIKLNNSYLGSTKVTPAIYSKGEYISADLNLAYRYDDLVTMGDDFFWLAHRSDTSMQIGSYTHYKYIPAGQFREDSVDIYVFDQELEIVNPIIDSSSRDSSLFCLYSEVGPVWFYYSHPDFGPFTPPSFTARWEAIDIDASTAINNIATATHNKITALFSELKISTSVLNNKITIDGLVNGKRTSAASIYFQPINPYIQFNQIASSPYPTGPEPKLVNGDLVRFYANYYFNEVITVEDDHIISIKAQTLNTVLWASWAVVTTTTRDSIGGFQLESANHGFEDGYTINVVSDDSRIQGTFEISSSAGSEFKLPIYISDADVNPIVIDDSCLAACVKMNLRTEFGAVRLIGGDAININEPETKNIINYVGMESLSSLTPIYNVPSGYNTLEAMQNYNCYPDDNLTDRIAKLTAMMADRVQDRAITVSGDYNFRMESGILKINPAPCYLTVTIPGSPIHIVEVPNSLDLSSDGKLVVFDISRKEEASSVSVVATTMNLSVYTMIENKFILFCSSANGLITWNGTLIKDNTSWISSDHDTNKNRNIFVQDKSGIMFSGFTGVFSYRNDLENVYVIIPGSSYYNIIDTAEINLLSDATRTIDEGYAVWGWINKSTLKTFNQISNTIIADDDTNGILFKTPISDVPVDQDVFVFYIRKDNALIAEHHETPIGGIYDEDYSVVAPISSSSSITLPLNTRNGNDIQKYVVGSGQLEVYLNGQRIRLGEDWDETGLLGTLSGQIEILQDLVIGDVLTFRISQGTVYFTPAPGSAQTLQETYNYGNTITTTPGNPVSISGAPGEKLLVVDGDVDITGVIDPKGITFDPQSSNPLSTLNGLWLNNSGELIHERPGESTPVINITDILINSSTGMSDPMTTAGDLIYRNPSNTTTRLPIGSVGQTLSVTSATSVEWISPVAASQEIYLINNTGALLNALELLRIDTSGGVDFIDPSIEAEALAVIGISKSSANHGDPVGICTSGKLENIGGAWGFGDLLFLSKVGGLTNIKPDIGVGGFVSGDFVIKVGVVSKSITNPADKDLMLAIQIIGQL